MTDYTELQAELEAKKAAGWECTDGLSIDTVLALIAENERVKARLCVCRDCGGQGELYAGHSSYQGHNQPPEPDMDVCGTCGGDGVLGPLEDFEALADERDQLKAENEALRKHQPSAEVIWCACGDGHAGNSYGAGFMDANGGVCANCDAAMGKGEQS